MGKPELGQKLTCTSCQARFYDLSRTPAVCPKCDAVQPPPKPRVSYPARNAARRWQSRGPAPATAEQAIEDVAVVADPDEEEDLEAVDTPEIDDDDDDVITPDVAIET